MNWTPVESSQIKEIGYDHESSILGIRFHPSKKAREAGATHSEYHYANVGPEMHASLMAAESKGRFFDANIKAFPKDFPFTKVG